MPRKGFVSLALVASWARHLAGPVSAVAFVLVASSVRLLLGQVIPGLTVFSLYYPAILAAALVGGGLAAGVALVLSVAISWTVLHHAQSPLMPMAAIVVNLILLTVSGAFIGAVGARLRHLLRRNQVNMLRLTERDARYRALFDGVTEGFALLEGSWSSDGRLLDFTFVEVNPAMLKMFRIDATILGRRYSQYAGRLPPEYLAACETAFASGSVHREIADPLRSRWFDIRMSRVGETKLAQIFVDITERKAAEQRQTEMFDELNHRVKNNLAAVSAMLSMQARASDDPSLRDQLQKAVDRIQTIADVHASLYRVSSTDDVDFTIYLQRLCERLAASLVDGERLRIEVDADPVMAPLQEAVALGLIVNELVTNAAKHAYPAPASGVIQVRLRNRSGELELRVSDQGRGLPQTGEAAGIGMRLVRSLVQQCSGELDVEHSPGACFTVRLGEHRAAGGQTAQSRLL
jgi:two-component sensor histidine kinase/PAS domain-containing protein